MIAKSSLNLLDLSDGEFLVAYLSGIEIRNAGSFKDDTGTVREYEQGLKAVFSQTVVSKSEFAGEIIESEKIVSYATTVVMKDDKSLLNAYKDFKANMGARFIIFHDGIISSTIRGVSFDDIFIIQKETTHKEPSNNKVTK